MIKIQHRVNSIKKLENTNKNFGVEIDVRSYKKKLVLNHEPFKKSDLLSQYLKKFDHKFLILNVKEEGIEDLIHTYINKYKIKEYFLLDSTLPKIFESVKLRKKLGFCLRISKFEKLNGVNFFNKKIKWIWIDTFENEIPLSIEKLKFFSKKFKLCLVSPELVKSNNIKLTKFLRINKNKLKFFKAVCSKDLLTWTNYGY